MENNHDARKQQINAHIRKSGKVSLIITIIVLIWQIPSFGYQFAYTIRQSDTLEIHSVLDIINYQPFGTVPDLIVKSLMTLGSLILLILLFNGLRKNGLPFTERNRKLVRNIGIIQGFQALLPPVFRLIQNLPNKEYLDARSNLIMTFFHPSNLNYFTLNISVLLLFLSWILRYGAELQQESDETL